MEYDKLLNEIGRCALSYSSKIQLALEGSADGITHCDVLNRGLRYLAAISFKSYKKL